MVFFLKRPNKVIFSFNPGHSEFYLRRSRAGLGLLHDVVFVVVVVVATLVNIFSCCQDDHKGTEHQEG